MGMEALFPRWSQMSARRMEHARRVARLLGEWADAMGVGQSERACWERAAYLHDALKDAPDSWLAEVTDDAWGVAALSHGPAAARMAAQHGETDEGVLQAVRYHSVGYADWDRVGIMLYLADFLEPERTDAPDRAELAAGVPAALTDTLRAVARARIGYLVANGKRLLPETVEFWNGLR